MGLYSAAYSAVRRVASYRAKICSGKDSEDQKGMAGETMLFRVMVSLREEGGWF